MGDGRGGRDDLCSSYGELLHWKTVKHEKANRHPKPVQTGEENSCATES